MGGLKAENLDWLDRLETLRAQPSDASRSKLKEVLNSGNSHITDLQTLKPCFDQAAIDKVRLAAQENPPYILSFNSAKALARLKKVKAGDLTAFHSALDVTLSLRLNPLKIESLVDWMKAGNPADSFDPNQKTTRTKEDKTDKGKGEDLGDQPAGKAIDLDYKKLAELANKAETEKTQGKETTAQEKLKAYIVKIAAALSPTKSSSTGEVISETVLLDWLADINVFKQLQSKRKKGKSLTGGEWTLLLVHKLGELLGHGLKHLLKLFKPLLKLLHWALKMVIEALKDLGLYKYAKAIFTLVVLIAVIWFSWEAFHYGLIRPVEILWSKIHFSHAAEESATPVANGNNNEPLVQPSLVARLVASQQALTPKKIPTPVPTTIVYQPSIAFVPAAEDPKVLDIEMASVPPNSGIKDHAVTLDEGIPGDLAVSRLQGVTDPDKYTMMIGNGKQIITSVNATPTNLIVYYKSPDPLALSGGGPINIFWEDIKVIHVNEIDHFSKPGLDPDVTYQFGLVAAGAKIPLTIQCNSPDDLQHLVSTIEYFIRNSRLGHDTPFGGLPYPHQGLVLNGDAVVEKLWADSPAGRANVQLGDHLWSFGYITQKPQSRNELEAGLSTLPTTLFTASSSVWDKALIAFHAPGQGNPFKPRLRKVTLSSP
jgi:hypothetical protein